MDFGNNVALSPITYRHVLRHEHARQLRRCVDMDFWTNVRRPPFPLQAVQEVHRVLVPGLPLCWVAAPTESPLVLLVLPPAEFPESECPLLSAQCRCHS